MTIEQKMARYITDNGLKINFVAEKAGVPYQRLQSALNGGRKIKTDEFLATCAALEVDPYLFRADETA